MFKKSLSAVLALLMLMSLCGAVGFGVITASASGPSYYEFTKMPGFSVWSDEELDQLFHDQTYGGVHSTANMPEGVDDVVGFKVISPDPLYGAINIGSYLPRNLATSRNGVLTVPDWAAVTALNGKTLVGDQSFEDCDGIAFWMGFNNDKYTAKLKIQLGLSPAKGPFYNGTDDGLNDLDDAPVGYKYESSTIYADEQGYFYYDFEKDFRQVDWWATDDDGICQSVYQIGETNTPLPEKVKAEFNSINFVCFGAKKNDIIYIGDIKGYKDMRVFEDDLDEACARFDSLNVEAYSDASYTAATNVYMEAYDMLADIDSYTQEQVDAMTRRLNNAIDSLDNLFPVAADAGINGFDVWDDSALEEMADGGICLDLAFTDYEIHPAGRDDSIGIISTATDGPPSYGWSYFTNAVDYGDGLEVVGNPFGATISDTAGMGFWVKYGEGFEPSEFALSVGYAAEEMQFTATDPAVHYPTDGNTEGLVYVAWADFEADDGESDIFDYLDSLDYIVISLPDSNQKQLNIADLFVFNWETSPADFTEFDAAFAQLKADVEAFNESEYYPKSWDNLAKFMEMGERMHNKYGVTTEALADFTSHAQKAFENLEKIGEGAADYEALSELHNIYKAAKKLWSGNYTLSAGNKLSKAVSAYEGAANSALTPEQTATLKASFETAFSGLKTIKPKSYNDDIISFEDYSPFDLDYCAAMRSPGVSYSMDELGELGNALTMTATRDLSGTAMTFYPYYNNYFTRPLRKGLCGNLAGCNGFIFYVSVNDYSLAKDAYITFGLMNTRIEKAFNKYAADIPIPASGKGYVFVPTYSITGMTEGSAAINMGSIDAYYFAVQGEVLEGCEISITGIRAYAGSSNVATEMPVVTNVTDGTTYDAGFVPEWTEGTALLDGKAYDAGTPVTVNGEHTFKVINGGASEVTVTFGITGGTDPVVPVTAMLGDMDGDETITVADALAALRIGAKLVEETPEAIAVGDVDKDGHITVADALAILRVAAKLADHF